MIPLGFHIEEIGHSLPGAAYRGAIVWHKGPVNTTAWGSWRSPSNPVLRGTYEMVHIWSKRSMGRDGGRGDLSSGAFTEATLDTWHIAAEQSRQDHPAPFPVALAERLIRLYSWPGERVLDPFCGIGSSGVAAARSERSWVGVDVSAVYCDIARRRIANERPVTDTSELDNELVAFAHELAVTLAAGAHAAGILEVRRFHVTENGPWERYRRTLSNHVHVGAYAVARKNDGSRVGWTTSHSRPQLTTLRRWSRKPVRTIRGDVRHATRSRAPRRCDAHACRCDNRPPHLVSDSSWIHLPVATSARPYCRLCATWGGTCDRAIIVARSEASSGERYERSLECLVETASRVRRSSTRSSTSPGS